MMRRATVCRADVWYNPELRFTADYDLYVRIAPYARFANIDKILYYYRRHAEQLSAKLYSRQLEVGVAISQNHLAQFGINADKDTIRLIRTYRSRSPLSVSGEQREKVAALGADLAQVRDFYGYRGLSQYFMWHLLQVTGAHTIKKHTCPECLTGMWT